jgi:hypothetical protein
LIRLRLAFEDVCAVIVEAVVLRFLAIPKGSDLAAGAQAEAV